MNRRILIAGAVTGISLVSVGAGLAPAEASTATPTCVGAAGEGAPEARPTFDEALARFQHAIYRDALHLTGKPVTAADRYKETMSTAHHRFDRLDASGNHHVSLYQIATDIFVSNRRRRSKEGPLAQERTASDLAATQEKT